MCDVSAGSIKILGNGGASLDGTQGGFTPAGILQVGGSNGTDLYALNSDTSGNIGVNVKNTPVVTGSGVFEVGPTASANTANNSFFNE